MIDRYTKIVLTIIAVALVVLVAQAAVGQARAIGDGSNCRDPKNPCYVTTNPEYPLFVVQRTY